ncbi:MAG: aconitase/3-isopropylmalate dehydratase large subunit family protein [Bacteroidales bacterium]|nr:aconitase/3-isopropylmalate dehydratase large subunit family protein [Bacteroidales bacterium]MDY0285528.1 aconitase/3-isopropylmalate dehydratase large subunit family protein [Bacteroidales bacterium]
MAGKTFVEKLLGAACGSIVFKKPDLVLTHDNTASIAKTFEKMGGKKVYDSDQLLVVLDHNAPPTTSKLATQYQDIRNFVKNQGIRRFHDAGDGICHQVMSEHARPGMLIVGSDSHTCTAGAFNALAAGIDRTESAGIWKRGETWFLVPESMKITLTGILPEGVYAKDLSLHIIGRISSDGANYMSIEFHGEGVKSLTVSQRMTLANLASEMGAKNAVFPADQVLADFYGEPVQGVWADDDAVYAKELTINLSELYPLVAAPHHVDNVKSVPEVAGTLLNQGVIGTCTNGRLEDLAIAAAILRGRKVADGFQLLVIPASKQIYLDAMEKGYIQDLLKAGANVLSPSCGPCLGTGQGIPADGYTVISTANRNFLGRMGNKEASIFLASPATVAWSSIHGKISDPRSIKGKEVFPYKRGKQATVIIGESDDRKTGNVWNYADVDNLNTDQMFAGNLTYSILSSDAETIMPHLFAGFDPTFHLRVAKGDLLFAGDNFGCGSSREHPAVGLAFAGVKAVIVKSVNRIFYRSSVNQGLPIIILPQAVEAYRPGDNVALDFEKGELTVGNTVIRFSPLPEQLMEIFNAKGLVNFLKMK